MFPTKMASPNPSTKISDRSNDSVELYPSPRKLMQRVHLHGFISNSEVTNVTIRGASKKVAKIFPMALASVD